MPTRKTFLKQEVTNFIIKCGEVANFAESSTYSQTTENNNCTSSDADTLCDGSPVFPL